MSTSGARKKRKIEPTIPQWSELHHDLLGLVIARLLFPHDRARLRAVCRSWRMAVFEFERGPAHRRMPWVVLSDGSFLMPSDRSNFYEDLVLLPDGSVLPTPESTVLGRLPSLPENATCIGSTDNWLALDCVGDAANRHSYLLHDPFAGKTVPLHELATVIGGASELFEIRKVLMCSTSDDVIVLLTNNFNYPISS
jgi:hypothetical protein